MTHLVDDNILDIYNIMKKENRPMFLIKGKNGDRDNNEVVTLSLSNKGGEIGNIFDTMFVEAMTTEDNDKLFFHAGEILISAVNIIFNGKTELMSDNGRKLIEGLKTQIYDTKDLSITEKE